MKPTLEEVQEYFKDAEIVESLYGQEFTGLKDIHEFCGEWFCKNDNIKQDRCIWKDDSYATIIKTKTMKLEVTEETIKSYHNDACQSFKTRIEKDFPSLFEVELEVGKWYRSTKSNKVIYFLKEIGTDIPVGSLMAYGINYKGEWMDLKRFGDATEKNQVPATDEEVSTALIAEAKRRGYKNGNHKCLSAFSTRKSTKSKYFFLDGNLWIGEKVNCNLIFRDGVWAEIVKEEPVYEWQYVYYDDDSRTYGLTMAFYTSKKDFLKTLDNLKPIHKEKVSKRIRE